MLIIAQNNFDISIKLKHDVPEFVNHLKSVETRFNGFKMKLVERTICAAESLT